jgi:hypothetical protein
MLPELFAVHGFGHAQPMFVRKGTDRVLTQSPCQTAFIIDVAFSLSGLTADARRYLRKFATCRTALIDKSVV